MRTSIIASALAAVTALATPLSPAMAAEVRLLNWSDYLAPEIPARFEAETGMKLVVEEVDDYDEMVARLRGGRKFDLAVPSSYHVRSLASAGLIEKIQPSRLPGYAAIQEQWRSPPYDPANEYSIPWHWGTTSFVVDPAKVGEPPYSLSLLFAPPAGQKVGLLDEGEEIVGLALKHLSRPRCSTAQQDIDDVANLLRKVLPQAVVYTNENLPKRLASSGLAVQMAWNGDALRARRINANLRYAYPTEGVTVWSDVLVVPKGAPNLDGAKRFMSFMMRPEIAALQSSHTLFATAAEGSGDWLPADLRSAPEIIVPPSAKLNFLSACSAEVNERYRALWADLKKKKAKK